MRDHSLALSSLKQKLDDINSQTQTQEIKEMKKELEYYIEKMKLIIKNDEEKSKMKQTDNFNQMQI